MDRLVKPDVKEVEIAFKRAQKGTTTFRLTNLMHTMSVAVSLTTTTPSVFSFTQPLSIIPPLSSLSYTVVLSQQSDHAPRLTTPRDTITVKTAMLPTGKAHVEELRRLFSRPGSHVFKDATIDISLVGPHVIEYLISNQAKIKTFHDMPSYFHKATRGCTRSQLTALLEPAVLSGNASMVTSLIDEGGDVNFKDPNGRSMVSLAIKSGSSDVLKVLIASGCRIDESVDEVLHEAASLNRVDMMEILCNNFKNIDINSTDSNGRSPIHLAASRGHVEAIRLILSTGGNAAVFDINGWSPLHAAAENGHLGAVQCLLENTSAAAAGYLIKQVVNREGKTAFAIAKENEQSHLYDLLQLGDELLRAARIGDVNGIKSCLAQGAKVNGRDQHGWTPLHRAAFKGWIECVKVLINNGAQVDSVDDSGYSPLHSAIEAGHKEVAMVLIAHGAKPSYVIKNLLNKKKVDDDDDDVVASNDKDCFKNHPSFVEPFCQDKECA